MVLEKQPTIQMKASECPVETVTVFSNTAEVTRLVHVKVQEGIQDVVIKGFSGRIDTNSLRVTAGGKEKISIIEVTYGQKPVPISAELNAELEEKTSQLKELEGLEDKLRTRNIEIEESKKFIESYATRLTSDPTNQTDLGDLLTETSIKGIHQFLKIYKQKLETSDFDQQELSKGLRDLRQQKMVLNEELKELKKVASEITHEIAITLFANETASLFLRLLYVVDSCKWSSSYDVRASAHDSYRVSLTYYGVIQQNTGEDWEKAKVILSTAKPSFSGTPPVLGMQTIQLRSNSPARPPPTRKKIAHPIDMRSKRKTVDLTAGFTMEDLAAAAAAEESSIMASLSAAHSIHDKTVHASSVVFPVQTPTTIKGDDKPHKVTLLVSELDSRFTHTCVPRLEQRSYLKASITNSTDHPFLAGSASIFYDNSFVSTSQIHDIAPQENFEVRLGIDHTVKVEYKPINKHKETHLTSRINSQTFSHKIVVTNTRPADADVIVLEQYPKSGDEKIRVRLVEPSQEEGPNHAINDAHNIEWRVIVKSNHATEIPYSFAVEWPLDREVDLSTLA